MGWGGVWPEGGVGEGEEGPAYQHTNIWDILGNIPVLTLRARKVKRRSWRPTPLPWPRGGRYCVDEWCSFAQGAGLVGAWQESLEGWRVIRGITGGCLEEREGSHWRFGVVLGSH